MAKEDHINKTYGEGRMEPREIGEIYDRMGAQDQKITRIETTQENSANLINQMAHEMAELGQFVRSLGERLAERGQISWSLVATLIFGSLTAIAIWSGMVGGIILMQINSKTRPLEIIESYQERDIEQNKNDIAELQRQFHQHEKKHP